MLACAKVALVALGVLCLLVPLALARGTTVQSEDALARLTKQWEMVSQSKTKRNSPQQLEERACGVADVAGKRHPHPEQHAHATTQSQTEQTTVTLTQTEGAELSMEFSAFGQVISVQLAPDTSILSHGYLEVVYARSGSYLPVGNRSNAEQFLASCHFAASSSSSSAGEVVVSGQVSLCDVGNSFANIIVNSVQFTLVPSHISTEAEDEPTKGHNLRKISPSQWQLTLRGLHNVTREPLVQNVNQHRKRDATHTIQALVISDLLRSAAFGGQTAENTLQVASIASTFYTNSPFAGGGVQLVLVGQVIFSAEYLDNFPITYRTCDTVDPRTTTLGCHLGQSGAAAPLTSALATEIDSTMALNDLRALYAQQKPVLAELFGQTIDQYALISGSNFEGSVIGLASTDTICSNQAGAVVQQQAGTAVTAQVYAHEIGHNLGFQHDTQTGFIMAPSVDPANTAFSTTSLGRWMTNLANNKYSCLLDGGTTVSLATCGNGVVDVGEQCDASFLADSCCNRSTCTLNPGCVCANNEVCCTNGALMSANTTCRPFRGPCDLEDKCSGSSGSCVDYVHGPLQSCTDSLSQSSVCMMGICTRSRTLQCRAVNNFQYPDAIASNDTTSCSLLRCVNNAAPFTWNVLVDDGTPCGPPGSVGSACLRGVCVPLNYTWVVGGWAPGCQGQYRYRDVWCRLPSFQVVVPDDYCDHSSKPETFKECDITQPTTGQFTTGTTSIASTTSTETTHMTQPIGTGATTATAPTAAQTTGTTTSASTPTERPTSTTAVSSTTDDVEAQVSAAGFLLSSIATAAAFALVIM